MRAVSIRDLCIFLVLGLGLAASLPLALAAAGPARVGQPALVLAAPLSGGAAAVIARAGGREVGPDLAALGRIAVLPDIERARREGAWLIVDAGALAALCGT